MLFTHLKPDFYRQQADNILALNPQLFCQQIDKKSIHWYNELLYMFFHSCSYKTSCFYDPTSHWEFCKFFSHFHYG